jgi:hypothetical protein
MSKKDAINEGEYGLNETTYSVNSITGNQAVQAKKAVLQAQM